MGEQVPGVVEACAQLERKVGELYAVFHAAFPEHADFWMQLCLEEQNHAALFDSGQKYFAPVGRFPADLMAVSPKDLSAVSDRVGSLLVSYQRKLPSVEEAFNVALSLEQSAGEIHFQRFMEERGGSSLDQIFRQLNRDDKDHAERLRARMREFGIPIAEGSSGTEA